MKLIKITILVFAAIMLFSCSKQRGKETEKVPEQKEGKQKESLNSAGVKEHGAELRIEYQKPRNIFKIEKEDLNNDSVKEIIVLSVSKDTADKYNDYYNFDMIEIFSLDKSKGAYMKILSDTVDYSKSCSFVSMNDDGKKQILLETDFGGNDKIASRGMFVFAMNDSGKVNLVKYFDAGAPEIVDIKNDGKKEIIVSDLFYGVMPAVNAIDFVKEIYKFEGSKLVEENSKFGDFYGKKIDDLLEKYYGLKRKVEMGMQPVNMAYPLYREAAEVIVNYYAKGDIEGMKKFWNEEKESLRRNIPEDEFTDLNNFISKAMPSTKNA